MSPGTTVRNRISTGRGTLGAAPSPNKEWCHGGSGHGPTVRINVDGVWSYLCQDCWDALDRFVREAFNAQ